VSKDPPLRDFYFIERRSPPERRGQTVEQAIAAEAEASTAAVVTEAAA